MSSKSDDIWDLMDENLSHVSIVDIETTETMETDQKSKKKKIQNPVEIKIIITRNGTYIDNTEKLASIIKKIQNYFTLHDKQITGYIKHTSIWYYKNKRLYIPRFGALFLKNKFENISISNKITVDNIIEQSDTTDLTKYPTKYLGSCAGNQELIFKHIMKNIFSKKQVDNGKSGLILKLEAGQGKTYLAMYIISILKCRTLVVTHNTSILNQWTEVLRAKFPNLKIGEYYGKKKTNGDVIVGVINSLVSGEIKLIGINTPEQFFSGFDLVIFDEVHEYCSSTRRQIYEIAQCSYMLGLSATPDERNDSLDKVNHWGCGNILHAAELPGYTMENIAFTGKVTNIKYSGPAEYTQHLTNEKLDITSVPLMIGQLCDDPYRLKLVTELVLEQYKAGLNVLVFADRRSYLSQIHKELETLATLHYLTDDKELAHLKAIRLVGGSSQEDITDAKETKNIILATYQYFGTGVSIPKLNAVVLTTPRKTKSEQFIKRIFRMGSNYEIERQIIDIVDVKTTLKSQWYTRKTYYMEQGYEIIERKTSWKDL